ncbi:MAG TPA: tetratricopeptide repeat protein, partial [Blastocatellia bacterium]|nr:tetratricopeptide repeat protein [Blastocatellia bacterium]
MTSVTTREKALICVLLSAITLAAYWQVLGFSYVSYDDPEYVTNNIKVQAGLTLSNVRWAGAAVVASHWHPLTLLSHMVDCQVFGLGPAGHHLMNLVLHLANVLLLFWVLQLATGLAWRSAFVAAFFAVHPMNVESVAWVAERKNVLSTFFFMLAIWAYIRYARSPTWKRYLFVPVLLLLGLMSKPMLVTAPFVLLLLDYWPLGRWKAAAASTHASGTPREASDGAAKLSEPERPVTRRRLLLEKAPLLLLSGLSVVMTMRSIGDTLTSKTFAPFGSRISNVLVSYVAYLYTSAWPTNLAVFYPYRGTSIPFWQVSLAAAGLVAATAIAMLLGRRFKFLAFGWFWYLGILVPVIGVVQAGYQSRADRYAYISLIGVFIILVWTAAEITRHSKRGRLAVLTLGLCVLPAMIVFTRQQAWYWRDTIALFQHAERVTSGNYVAYSNLGSAYLTAGRLDEAAAEYSKTSPEDPSYADSLQNLGTICLQRGEIDRAVSYLRSAIEAAPDSFAPYNKLGIVLAQS